MHNTCLFLQGAECTPVDGAGLTHLVVSDDVPPDSTPIAPSRVMVVKQQVLTYHALIYVIRIISK